MKNINFAPAAHCIGALATVAVISLAGCQRSSEPATSSSSAEYPSTAPAVEDNATAAAGAIKVTVSLSPAIAGSAAPGDAVFIFARAAQGPRMPLAVVRKQVKDLPATVVLDDSLSMSPDMKLSTVPEVVVVARVSKSGNAYAHAGDLEGMSTPLKPGTQPVAVSIAQVVTGK